MRFWPSLAGICLSALVCLNAADLSGMFEQFNGQAFITQAGQASAVTATREAEANFGMTWDSVRTFKLAQPSPTPLKVFIETKPADAKLFKPQYKAFVLETMEAWSSAMDNRLAFELIDTRKGADITVGWVPRFEDNYVAGVTTYRVGHADIEMKTVGVPEKDIKANILHEFGHALGIANHSGNPGDIMVAVRRWQRGSSTAYTPKLSARDVQAIRRLYSMDWKKGEDLYSSTAQAKTVAANPAAPVAVPKETVKQPATQQSVVLHLVGSNQPGANAPKLPPYTQIPPERH